MFLGYLFGALATVAIMYISGQHNFGSGAVGRTALNIALAKVEFGFLQAIALGKWQNIASSKNDRRRSMS